MKSIGPRTVPCGTPLMTRLKDDFAPSTTTVWSLLAKTLKTLSANGDFGHWCHNVLPWRAVFCGLLCRRLWHSPDRSHQLLHHRREFKIVTDMIRYFHLIKCEDTIRSLYFCILWFIPLLVTTVKATCLLLTVFKLCWTFLDNCTMFVDNVPITQLRAW